MSHYILSRIPGRILCVALTIMVFANVYGVKPAFAAEELALRVAGLVTKPFVSEPSNIVGTDGSSGFSEPLSLIRPEPMEVSEPLISAKSEPIKVADPLRVPRHDISDPAFEPVKHPEDSEIYDLILSVERKKNILSQAIIGFERGTSYYIPLKRLTGLVKFPTTLDLENGRASGTFFNIKNTYSLDTKAQTFTIRGVTTRLPEGAFIRERHGESLGDIYVELETLNKIFPLRLELNFSNMSLDIKTPKKLPYELERARRKAQGHLDDLGADSQNTDLEFVPNGYRWIGRPILRLSNSARWDNGRKLWNNNLSIGGKNDILGTEADYSLSLLYDQGESVDLTNTRLLLTRRDFGKRTLPLGLKLVQAGDISANAPSLVQRRVSGRGIYISSEKERENNLFDEIVISGTGQPGWEVEIYRGTELLDFTYIDERGEYAFEDIQLNFGKNIMRTVFYGPQGEIVERTKDYYIGRKHLKPGQMNFEASIINTGKPLINVSKTKTEDQNNTRIFRVNRGINKNISGFATLTELPTKEGQKTYLSAGGDVNIFDGKGRIEAYKEIGGGEAIDGRFSTKFAGINTNIKASIFKDFESKQAGFGDRAKTFFGDVRLSKDAVLPFARLNLSARAKHTRYKDSPSKTALKSTQSISKTGLSLNNSLDVDFYDRKYKSSGGKTSFSAALSKNINLRTSLDYKIDPTFALKTATLELAYRGENKFNTALRMTQGLEDRKKTSATLSSSYDFDAFLGGAELGWNRGEGIDFMLRASTTFGPESTDSNAYIFSSRYSGYATGLKVHLYHDKNANGVFDGDDEPVVGAPIRINARRSKISDENGIIEYDSIGPARLAKLTIDPEKMPNPFLAPLNGDGYETIFRPGTKPFINFPLIETGTIDGTVRNAQRRTIPGLKIQLISNHGLVLKETTTGFDGFYSFEFVRPGTYMVRPDASVQVNVPPKTVRLTSNDLFAFGVDLNPVEQALEVSVAAEVAVGGSGRIAQLDDHALVADGTLKSAPHSEDGNFSAVVHQVRIGEHPYKLRLVLDLSVMALYSISSEDEGRIINIDLPDTAWEATREWILSDHPFFKDVKVMALAGEKGGTRLRLTAHEATTIFYNALLPANDQKGPRLYIDFLKK